MIQFKIIDDDVHNDVRIDWMPIGQVYVNLRMTLV